MRSKVAENKGRSSAVIRKRKPKKKKTTEEPYNAQSSDLIISTEQFNAKSIYLIYIYFILGTVIFISILLALLRCIYIKRYRKKIKYEKISNATESETAVTQDESIIVLYSFTENGEPIHPPKPLPPNNASGVITYHGSAWVPKALSYVISQ